MKCQECINLWQVIFNENIVKMFIPVCLDNYSSKQISQLSIKEIPAIVISAENQSSMIFEGPQKCSQWLTSFTINRRKNLAIQVENQRRLIQKAQAISRAQDGGPIEYTDTEMDGITDNYAYTATDLCQPKSYMMIGEEHKYNIITPMLTEGKIDIDYMKQQLTDLENQRNSEKQQLMNVMEQSQIKAVLNYNNNQY
jgi:hypothetical protein